VSSGPDRHSAAGRISFERILRRDRALTAAGLVLLCVLAWVYVLTGAGTGMSVWAMTALSLFPHLDSAGEAITPAWSAGYWLLMVAMWWIMMIAMMAPSAAPTILLYTRVHQHAGASGQHRDSLAPSGAFVAGYLLVWLGFSMLATLAQWSLERSGLLSAVTMGSQSRWLSAALLVAAGVYQFLPVKHTCLAHCRSPASFLSRHWRPHAAGAVRVGALHGAFCLGCCWVLMALLFVGGVMNVVWIAALAVFVLIEKVFAAGRWVGRGVGVALIVWAVATLWIA
jgi:predicted metal-binding membrane protein